jgi:hypothetical protein
LLAGLGGRFDAIDCRAGVEWVHHNAADGIAAHKSADSFSALPVSAPGPKLH